MTAGAFPHRYVQAMERYPKTMGGPKSGEPYGGCGYQLWASCGVSAILWLTMPGGEAAERPEW